MRQGATFSAIFHIALALLMIFGLPLFSDPKPIEDQPIVLEMVTIAEKSNPRPNPTPVVEAPKPIPQQEAKPLPAPPPPAPQPTQAPTPTPPQVAERAPTPTPTPKPPEPKPEVKPPEPVPVPKPEVKKPEPPKPEPPKQQAQQTPPPKKPDPPKKEPPKEDPIAAILKNLAPTKPAPQQPNQQPRLQQQAAATPAAPPSLDQVIKRSDIDAVKEQIIPCWSPPVGARDAKDLVIQIKADMAPDGKVMRATIVNNGRMSDPFYRAAAESAWRAVLNNECHKPLKLPAGKYNDWRTIDLFFDPRDMLG